MPGGKETAGPAGRGHPPGRERIHRPLAERGQLRGEPLTYGRSVLGARLEVWMPAGGSGARVAPVEVVVFGGIHGEEPDTAIVLSRALRSLPGPPDGCAVITGANPDGLARGTRGNARGVDLNRNFPTSDWRAGEVHHRWATELPQEVALGTGSAPASEPEAAALVDLLEKLQPKVVVALHGYLACVEDPDATALGEWIAARTGLPRVDDIGYPTPGSFGTWGRERGLPVITYEFAPASVEEQVEIHLPVLCDILAGAAPGR